MSQRRGSVLAATAVLSLAFVVATSNAQELPKSGVFGIDFVYATDAAGTTSQLYAIDAESLGTIALGAPIKAVPSRWAHRRRTLGALETQIVLADPLILMTPTGDAIGNGGIHFVDARTGSVSADFVVATGNPAGYDLALVEPLQMVFSAEDDGAGGTTLRGFSYAASGSLTPLSPALLTLPGSPAAYVNRIGVDLVNGSLQVPTADGVQIVAISASAPNVVLGAFVPAPVHAPATNPTCFDRADGRIWVVGTSSFNASGDPTEAGFLAWKADGSASWSAGFGAIPGRFPLRNYVPAVGSEELAVASDGTDAYAYFPLRDPDPTSFFIRESAIGVVRCVGTTAPVASNLPCPPPMGEPFSIPTVHGFRVAIESSEGPPWYTDPPGGAEKISIVYSPLDPLGAGTVDGVLAVAGPLGGRISCKGMDRPLWAEDGSGVFVTTSNFPGAPNPGSPGIEFLPVAPDFVVDDDTAPVTLVDNSTFPNQSITQSTIFSPRDPSYGGFLAGFSLVGTVFHDGLGAAMEWKKGRKKLGQKQLDASGFVQNTNIPDFPAILPRSFEDATSSLVPIPAAMGARRVSFNLHSAYGFLGLTMVTAMEDVVHVQPTGLDFLAELGLAPELDPLPIALPSGWITTSEITSW